MDRVSFGQSFSQSVTHSGHGEHRAWGRRTILPGQNGSGLVVEGLRGSIPQTSHLCFLTVRQSEFTLAVITVPAVCKRIGGLENWIFINSQPGYR